MIPMTNHPIELCKVEVRKSVPGEQGPQALVRLKLRTADVTGLNLPEREAIAALVQSVADTDEGAHTRRLTIKQQWESLEYTLTRPAPAQTDVEQPPVAAVGVAFTGAIVGTPEVKVVGVNEVAATWSVEATVSPEVVATLSALLGALEPPAQLTARREVGAQQELPHVA